MIMSNFHPVVSATTPEQALALAMGYYVGMPSVLIGTTNVRGCLNEAKIEDAPIVVESVKIEAPVVDLAEGETILADLSEDGIIFEMTDRADDLAEVVMISEDVDGTVWATYRTLDGVVSYVDSDRWSETFGEAVEVEIFAAWDRATVKNLRSLIEA